MNAYEELLEFLKDDEEVEGVVFGEFGLGDFDNLPIIPKDVQGRVLSLEEAKRYMQDWKFSGGYGAPDCAATYIWTNKRVIWVTKYDGATWLSSIPRNPEPIMPKLHGG